MTEPVAFPQNRTCPYRPAPGYRLLADRRPLSRISLYDGREAWAVTGYALARRLLADPRISSDHSDPAWPVANAAAAAARNFGADQKKVIGRLTALVGVDDPEHRARREVAEAGFTPGLIDALRPKLQEVADRQVDEMVAHGAPADLVSTFASPAALFSLYEALGIPREDQEYFKQQTGQLFGPAAVTAYDELVAYVAKLAGQHPAGSLLDAYLTAVGDGGAAEVLQLLLIMLVSGHHTTASSIAIGASALLQHPERLAELRADPALLPAAVDELSRVAAVTDGIQRVAAADIDVDGTTIAQGDGVFFVLSLINRDEQHYGQPEVLDWHRPDTGDHLGYGSGPHECVGLDLARAIMETAFGTLLKRLPNLRLAVAADEIPVNPGESFTGLVELPVAW
ncbi:MULTISPECIES: cytochrome P450 [unclassified Amycolatopsis]|uniref:cytochrome P450 n=1 Tax=unclassified Amycolatopsis TaxID=2618356 RepID=UPI002875770A|nr:MULTISPECIES: cytochrome P450 [unclassified Amycolatopsis]MDS0132446.1 cytochrome P450 [Amycolatopsis sp. 505]MDS0142730.1 cytochrome P450 [Amycolatopsis sp. CM201R]